MSSLISLNPTSFFLSHLPHLFSLSSQTNFFFSHLITTHPSIIYILIIYIKSSLPHTNPKGLKTRSTTTHSFTQALTASFWATSHSCWLLFPLTTTFHTNACHLILTPPFHTSYLTIPCNIHYYLLTLSHWHPPFWIPLPLPHLHFLFFYLLSQNPKSYHTLPFSSHTSKTYYPPLPPIIIPPYLVSTLLFILLSGDIETNPGPIPHFLQHHPNDHKIRHRTYFTSNTIQLKLEYQHISLSFAPYLDDTHPNHPATQQTHPFLYRFTIQHNQYTQPLLLYTLIVTISPLPTRCNLLLFQPSPFIINLLQ